MSGAGFTEVIASAAATWRSMEATTASTVNVGYRGFPLCDDQFAAHRPLDQQEVFMRLRLDRAIGFRADLLEAGGATFYIRRGEDSLLSRVMADGSLAHWQARGGLPQCDSYRQLLEPVTWLSRFRWEASARIVLNVRTCLTSRGRFGAPAVDLGLWGVNVVDLICDLATGVAVSLRGSV